MQACLANEPGHEVLSSWWGCTVTLTVGIQAAPALV